MTSRLTSRVTGEARNAGFVLAEVLVSIVLLAILIVPLATATDSSTRRAGSLWLQAGGLCVPPEAGGGDDPWTWGATVSGAEWTPGPALELRVAVPAAAGVVVGVWTEGWFEGELVPDEEGRVRLRASELAEAEGKEVVVRVRSESGAWGPPWRMVVPVRGAGSLDALPAPLAVESGEVPVVLGTMAHLPAVATQKVEASWLEAACGSDDGLPAVSLPGPAGGSCRVTLDGRSQSWWAEDARALDIYF